jgi:hypothetical protein
MAVNEQNTSWQGGGRYGLCAALSLLGRLVSDS